MSASSEKLRGLDSKTFRFHGKNYRYFRHDYNKTYLNERAVEVSIVWEAVKQCKGRVLEVGNVLSHYFSISHEVIDKYEKAEGVLNVDVVDFTPPTRYDLIVSISTLEHIGWDEKPKDPEKILQAFENLKALLNPGGMLLATLPLGYNPVLDHLLEKKKIKFTEFYCLKRISKDNHWREVGWGEIRGTKYDFPFPLANAIVIGVWRKPKAMGKTGSEELKNFLFFDNWFEKEFKDGLGERYNTSKTALNLFLQNRGKTIVETGTMRKLDLLGDGGSTLLFGKFCKMYGEHLYTVDLSPEAIKAAKRLTKEFKENITYVTSDSVEFLHHFKGEIDLLYLDSLDCPVEGDATEAQEHQLKELSAAFGKLSNRAVILLDDNNFLNGGKTRLAKERLLRNRFTLLIDSQQSVWISLSLRTTIWHYLRRMRRAVFPEQTPLEKIYLKVVRPLVKVVLREPE